MGDLDGDICVTKFNRTGQFQWYKTDGEDLTDVGYGIALDSLNNLYVTGKIENSGTGDDLYICKFSQQPDEFILLADTGSIDPDGNFALSWQPSLDADNYSLFIWGKDRHGWSGRGWFRGDWLEWDYE